MTRPRRLGRREFLRSLGLAGALLLAPAAGAQRLPRTGFERSGDRAWTSEEDEAALLAALASRSPRVAVAEVGHSRAGRPVRLARVGASSGPAVLFVCAQHGHEPAPREAALELLRDLAFTSDPAVLDQLRHQAVLAIPTANPDGRAAGRRGNGDADLNRDHLALRQPETRALHAALWTWSPDVVVDLHEYRPPDPTRFHHDLLYLWPRNLNVDPRLRALSQALGAAVARGARGAGLAADQYARAARQAATGPDPALPGGGDEAILRNAAGLSHRLGLLVETAVTLEGDAAGSPVTALRARVQAQRRAMDDVLGFLRRHGQRAHAASGAASRGRGAAGAAASRPVFFGGADDHPPAPAEVADPPPCRYLVDAAQAEPLAGVFALHGVRAEPAAGTVVTVSMAQPAASVIPLLLDPRARRALAAGTPDWCASA